MDEKHVILENLRKSGHRVTPQRVMILDVMRSRTGHITAEEVFQAVYAEQPFVNRSTVYRTLDMLTKEGLLTVTDLGTGPAAYELNTGEPHHHLVCQKCGHIEEFDHDLLSALQKSLQSQYKFQARLDHMAIFGLCAACQPRTHTGKEA